MREKLESHPGQQQIGSDWDATAYHRLSDPQFRWGLEVLSRLELRGDETVLDAGCGTGRLTAELLKRLPGGRVIAADVSPNMLGSARQFLRQEPGERVRFVQADLAQLDLDEQVDGIFSTATFHWVDDHDALFAALFRALRPGGWLVAQFGGKGNIERWRRRMAVLGNELPFVSYVRDWIEPVRFPDVAETAERLKRAGFSQVTVGTHPAPVSFPDPDSFRSFIANVIARNIVGSLNAALRPEFLDRLTVQAAQDAPPFTIDYVRLNVRAVRPAL